jgi:hypothetical protein
MGCLDAGVEANLGLSTPGHVQMGSTLFHTDMRPPSAQQELAVQTRMLGSAWSLEHCLVS